MTRYLVTTIVALMTLSCTARREGGATTARAANKPAAADSRDRWLGVYASTSEIGGFAGTVLMLEERPFNRIGYRMRAYTDVMSADEIPQDEHHGDCLIDGQTLYLPKAYGYMLDGKPMLLASITRYTLVDINGHTVLMRDDASRAFRAEKKLYDYGILIKVSDQSGMTIQVPEVQHPSIRVLYSDPNKPWSDPFVHGPNSR